jgi:hypothetical protein
MHGLDNASRWGSRKPDHFLDSGAVCSVTTLNDARQPFFTVLDHQLGVQFSPETAAQLRLVVAIETQHCEIGEHAVARDLIDVVNLHSLAALAAHATSRIRREQHVGDEI